MSREFRRISAVRSESRRLADELDRRRDGLAPRELDLPELRRALREVEPKALCA